MGIYKKKKVLCVPVTHYQTLERTFSAQLSVPDISFQDLTLLCFPVCVHYVYTPKHCIILYMLLNMQVFFSQHSVSLCLSQTQRDNLFSKNVH